MELPNIHIVDSTAVEAGFRYRIYAGYKNEKIVCLALSNLNRAYAIGKLLPEIDADFRDSSVYVDVYCRSSPEVTAKFWSEKYRYAYLDTILKDFVCEFGQIEKWSKALGVDIVSFSPFSGPADKPELFPGFPKQPRQLDANKNVPEITRAKPYVPGTKIINDIVILL